FPRFSGTGLAFVEGVFPLAAPLPGPLLAHPPSCPLLREWALQPQSTAPDCPAAGDGPGRGLRLFLPERCARPSEFTLNTESLMADPPCRRFFLDPSQPLHRRFAALHAVFVKGLSPQAIAERFGLAYHTVRSWVRDFRAQCRAAQVPPFSRSPAG